MKLLKVTLFLLALLGSHFNVNLTMVKSHPAFDPSNTNFSHEPLLNMSIITVWPLQESYPNSIIENLNDYISIFSGCLVNLQNFQGIDLYEWPIPIFLTRFDIAGGTRSTSDKIRHNLVKTSQFLYGHVPSVEILNNESYSLPELQQPSSTDAIKFRWNCFAKFDIFFPEIKDVFHFYFHYARNKERITFGPTRGSFDEWNLPNAFGQNIRPTHFILISHQNSSKVTRDFWVSRTKANLINANTENLYFLTTGNFADTKKSVLNSVFWSIISFFFFCFNCCDCKRVLIPLELNSWSTEVDRLNSLTDRVKWNLVGLQMGSEREKFVQLLWSNEKLTFRNFLSAKNLDKRHVPDKAMAEYVMPNGTFKFQFGIYPNRPDGIIYSGSLAKTKCYEFSQYIIEDCVEYNKDNLFLSVICYSPEITFEKLHNPALIRSTDEFTFVSCGVTPWQKTSIYGFFSSFDRATWGCIIIFILVWPVILSLIERDFKFRQVFLDSQTWLLGFVLLLEQGHCLVENRAGKGPLYYTCSLTLLVLIILSNAYKGKNIEQLSESFKIIPYENIEQILKDEYTILTKTDNTMNLDSETTLLMDFSGPQYETCKGEYGWQVSKDLLTRLDNEVQVHKEADNMRYYVSDTSYLEIVGKCDQIALLGWKSDIQTLFVQLLKRVKAPNQVFLGSKPLFQSNTGWWLFNWRDPNIPQRLAYLKQSGIPDEWIAVAKMYPLVTPVKPVSLSLNGNVMVQFYCLSTGLLIASVCFIIESCLKWLALIEKMFLFGYLIVIKAFKPFVRKVIVKDLFKFLSKVISTRMKYLL